jgi:hypothetical protein
LKEYEENREYLESAKKGNEYEVAEKEKAASRGVFGYQRYRDPYTIEELEKRIEELGLVPGPEEKRTQVNRGATREFINQSIITRQEQEAIRQQEEARRQQQVAIDEEAAAAAAFQFEVKAEEGGSEGVSLWRAFESAIIASSSASSASLSSRKISSFSML